MTGAFSLGDVVAMKKPHACGANEWTIIRVGADVKLRCVACGRIVMLEREAFIKKSKRLLQPAEAKT